MLLQPVRSQGDLSGCGEGGGAQECGGGNKETREKPLHIEIYTSAERGCQVELSSLLSTCFDTPLCQIAFAPPPPFLEVGTCPTTTTQQVIFQKNYALFLLF